MSRVSKTPTTSDKKCPPARGGRAVIRLPLVVIACALFLCALAAPAALPTPPGWLVRAAASGPAPAASQVEIPGPKLRIDASASFINVCPGEERRTRVALAARGVSAECRPRYSWSVTGGRVVGGGGEIVWDLSGEPPGRGFYEATVTVETGASCGPPRRATATWRVVAKRCPPHVASWSYASRLKARPAAAGFCPNISLCCRATARPGQPDVPFSAEVRGGTPGASPTYSWSVWGGQLTGGQGTDAVSVSVGGAGGRHVLARVEVGGYGTAAPCSATCTTELVSNSLPLRVLVRDSRHGRPVRGAQVTVRGDDGERVFPTDEGGNFERGDFAPREYVVRVNAAGFGEQEKRVSLGGLHGGSVVFSLIPSQGPPPAPPPAPEVAATPAPTPSPEVASLPTPAPYVAPPPPEYSCTGCCLLDDERDCRRLAALLAVVLGAGALCAGAAWSLWGLDGGLATGLADEVHCTVFAPFEAPPGDCFLVQAFAHLKGEAALLADRADDSDPDARLRGTKQLEGLVERGKRLEFSLQMRGLEIDQPTKSLVWGGELDAVQFYVTVPEDCKPGNLIGTVTVAYESVPIGHVMFKFKVVAVAAASQPAAADAGQAHAQVTAHAPVPAPCPPPAAPPPPPAQAQGFYRYRRAFISYASEDRAEVLKRVQMLRTFDIEFFHDVLTLEPGERWEQMLYKYIDASDVIYLFWSNAAKRSEWVEREVRYALERRSSNDVGLPAIVPVIIEGPPIVPPPEHLGDIHFNDKLLYFIKEEEAARRPAQ